MGLVALTENLILLQFEFCIDYDAEDGGKVLFKRNDVVCVSLLQRMSNTRERTITLDVEMEDYHRIKNRTEVTADATE